MSLHRAARLEGDDLATRTDRQMGYEPWNTLKNKKT